MPFPIKGSRIARRSRTATSRAYACVYNHGARGFLAETGRMNYILAGAYRCFAPDFDLEFARFLMVKNKRQVNADQYVLPTRPLAHNLTLRTVCDGKNKKNILSMQIFIAFPSVFNIWLGRTSLKKWIFCLFCTRLSLSLDKIGCGSEMQIKKFFICHCTRLSLSFNKIGCGSAEQA